MPFIPLSPEERKQAPKPCHDPEHDPPKNMVITERMKWMCPTCKRSIIIDPPGISH